ncbi:MAG: rod shape-determining protein MreD [Sphingomonadaceae bacterium]|nr:rod shape-determining protein MreD [Sphingomonadaceae bacterium]
MSKLRGADESLAPLRFRMRAIPVSSVAIGSLAPLLPLIAAWPLLPPLGLLMLLGWRFVRPETWPLWIGLPLGLFDDLLSGNPLGSAVFLWTAILVALDIFDNRFIWRDYWFDWLMATAAIAFYIVFSMLASSLADRGDPALAPLAPQLAASVLTFPLVLRLCARLDRWRLDW